MPTTYAHDAFGRELYKRLPKEIKTIIKENKQQYLIGLHGPDIFFYHFPFKNNAINMLGINLHNEKASNVLQRGIELYQQVPVNALLAYLIGFAGHYILDSACHGYIGLYEREYGVSHSEIETHMDRALMERDGKDPFQYYPANSICPKARRNYVIHKVFPEISQKEIIKCLKNMKLYTDLPVCKSGLKRTTLFLALKMVGCYESMQGQIMKKEKNPVCEKSTTILMKLYAEALESATFLIENLYQSALGKEQLSIEYQHDFL